MTGLPAKDGIFPSLARTHASCAHRLMRMMERRAPQIIAVALASVAVANGCSEPSPVHPAVPLPVAKQEGRAVFARVLERLTEDPPNVDEARRALERLQQPTGLDARIASTLAIVIDTLEAHHATHERLEHEAADLRLRLEATERALAEVQTRHDEQADQLVKIADERARLAKKLGEVESLLSNQEAELAALREELAALKRIDMQRNP